MAAILSRVDESVSQSCKESDVKQQLSCNYCVKYKCELEELILELSSAKKIIQLLQEDQNTHNDPTIARTSEDGSNPHVSNELNNNWEIVTDKSRKLKKLNEISPDQLPIPTIPITNRYHALHNLQNDTELPSIIPNQRTKYHHIKKETRDKKTTCERMKRQKKIVVIGDSHSRGLASELKNYLGHEYSISGTIIPGARLNNITQLAKNELTNLTRKDTIIIWGGSNDVYKNETQSGLKSLYTFVNRRANTNILTLMIPHRHDLSPHSCVNEEIQTYNRKLHKVMKNLDGVKVVDYDLSREDFTRHGLHINAKGKTKVAKNITQILTQFSKQNDVKLIPMHWTETISDPAQLRSMTEASNKETVHQNDKHEDEKEGEGDKLPSQTQPSKQNDTKLIPTQWIDTTSDPAHRRSITEALNQETTHQECDEHEEEEKETEGDKLPSKTYIQQKTSCRRKMIPHTRTDDFLWG